MFTFCELAASCCADVDTHGDDRAADESGRRNRLVGDKSAESDRDHGHHHEDVRRHGRGLALHDDEHQQEQSDGRGDEIRDRQLRLSIGGKHEALPGR